MGDDFLGTLKNLHRGCRWVLVRHSLASQPALDGAREMATLCISEHRLRPTEQLFRAVIFLLITFLFIELVVSHPRHASPGAECGLCSLIRLFSLLPLLSVSLAIPWKQGALGCDWFWSRQILPKRVCPASGPLCPLTEHGQPVQAERGCLVLCTGCVFSTLYTPVSFAP